MIHLPIDGAAVTHRLVEQPILVVEPPSHAEVPALPVPTEEQVHAIDGAFIRQQHEHETVASLIGLRLSVLLMHDLAKDAMPTAEKEEPPENKHDDADQPAD